MANDALLNAKKQQNDEFYTLYEYIQKEINAYLEYDPDIFRDKIVLCPCDDPEWSNFTKFFAQNFEMLGLKKLISTSYSMESKKAKYEQYRQITIYEILSPQYDEEKAITKGKIYTLTRDINKSGNIDYDDLEWQYLDGDGDFQSDEVKKLRDEADIIVTNPPFSLFRDFVAWILEADKEFLIIGQIGMATYKEIFPEIKNNRMWIGATCNNEDMVFEVPEGAKVNPKDREKAARMGYVGNYTRQGNACWFTNLDHGRRHEPLALMSMADNLRYSRHKDLKKKGYLTYYNYDGIDVPYVDAIPNDYEGVMGVPTSFLHRYNPDQFEIVDNGAYAPKTLNHIAYKSKKIICYEKDGKVVWTTPYTVSERKAGNGLRLNENGSPGGLPYGRILIRKRVNNNDN
ncbi:MAG: adenine-specific methyltransferase EcoRI family protein [Saccharofermentanales bacterium]|jgi:hypothetical protein